MPGRECAPRRESAPQPGASRHATFHGRRVRRYVFDGVPTDKNDSPERTCHIRGPDGLVLSGFPQYKRQRKSSTEPLDASKRTFLSSLLSVILEKLKWDEESDPEEMDEDDKAAFEELRKVGVAC